MFFFTLFTLLLVTLTTETDLTCQNVVVENGTCPHPNITFWLYNNNVMDYKLDPTNNDTIINAPFLNNVKTIFLLNGYNGNLTNFINEIVRPKYFELNYNVIALDYFPLVLKPCYLQAVENTNIISSCFAHFVKYILQFKIFSIEDVHVVGFSLGAQVAGRAATILKADNIIFPRLTGLDAAAPAFWGSLSHINSESAKFVDTIHTNSLLYGKLLSIGTVDFYVNEIILQIPCDATDEGNLILCSHTRACEYFATSFSIQPPYFCGQPIDFEALKVGQTKLGEYVSLNARGVYWVNTADEYPYAQDMSC